MKRKKVLRELRRGQMLAQEYCWAISERAATLRQAKQQLQVRTLWHRAHRSGTVASESAWAQRVPQQIGTHWPNLLSKEGGAARRKGPAGSITTYGHV